MRVSSSRRLQTSIMSDIASKTIPTQASALRKGSYVLLKDKPCKIVDLSTSKTGKHGHAKIKMTGIDIFTGQKVEDLSPSTHNMEVPVVKKDELQVCVRLFGHPDARQWRACATYHCRRPGAASSHRACAPSLSCSSLTSPRRATLP